MASLNNDLWIKNFFAFKRYVCASHILPFKYNTVISESGTDVYRWFLNQRYRAEKLSLLSDRLKTMSELLGDDWYSVPMVRVSYSLYTAYVSGLNDRLGLEEYSLKVTDIDLSMEDVVTCAKSGVVYLDDMLRCFATENIISDKRLYTLLSKYSIYRIDYWNYLLYSDLFGISLKSIYANRLQPCLQDIKDVSNKCSKLLSDKDYILLKEYYLLHRSAEVPSKSIAKSHGMALVEYNNYISGLLNTLRCLLKVDCKVSKDMFNSLIVDYNSIICALNNISDTIKGYSSKYEIITLFMNELGLKMKDAVCITDMLYNFTNISNNSIDNKR